MNEKQFIEKLRESNIRHYRSGDNIEITCPFHKDKIPSLGVNFRTNVWNCLGCGEKGSGREQMNFLFEALFGGWIEEEEEDESEDTKDLSELRSKIERIKDKGIKQEKGKIKVLKSFDINDYEKPHDAYADYLKGRKIYQAVWDRFDIRCGYYKNQHRIIVPMYDEFGRLVSVFARSIENNTTLRIRKTKNSDVKKILFGLNNIKGKRKVVLLEGEIDTIYMQQYNIPAVGLGKKVVSDIQLYKIGKYFKKVILSLDGDVEKEEVKKVANLISTVTDVEIAWMPKNKDPNNLCFGEIFEIYKKHFKGGIKDV